MSFYFLPVDRTGQLHIESESSGLKQNIHCLIYNYPRQQLGYFSPITLILELKYHDTNAIDPMCTLSTPCDKQLDISLCQGPAALQAARKLINVAENYTTLAV
jgi:hypothetical protein